MVGNALRQDSFKDQSNLYYSLSRLFRCLPFIEMQHERSRIKITVELWFVNTQCKCPWHIQTVLPRGSWTHAGLILRKMMPAGVKIWESAQMCSSWPQAYVVGIFVAHWNILCWYTSICTSICVLHGLIQPKGKLFWIFFIFLYIILIHLVRYVVVTTYMYTMCNNKIRVISISISSIITNFLCWEFRTFSHFEIYDRVL